MSDWLRSKDNNQLYEIARYVEEKTNLPKRFNQMTLEDLVDTECFPCIHEIILTKLMTEISDQSINADTIMKNSRKNVVRVSGMMNFNNFL